MHWNELLKAIGNTLVIGAGTALFAVPLGTLLAVLLLRTNVAGARLGWLMLSSQLVVPLYVFAGGWSAGFGTLGWWPLAPANLQFAELRSILAVVFIHAVAAGPWVCLIVSLGLAWSARSLEELAMLENGWRGVLRQVTLPSLVPWIALASVWSVAPVLTEMVVTNLYQVRTIPEQVYLDISLHGTSHWTLVAGICGCACPLALVLLVVVRQLPQRQPAARNSPHSFHRQPSYSLAAARIGSSIGVWCVISALVGMPIANLIYKAGWEVVPQIQYGATHRWSIYRFWLTIVETSTGFAAEVYWSTLLAAGSATLAMMLAGLMAYLRKRLGVPWLFYAVCILMVSVPGPVAGQWVTWLFNTVGWDVMLSLYDRTLLAPILAQQFRLLPLGYLLVNTILSGIDRQTWELAELDSLSRVNIVWRIVLPQTGWAWIVAWIVLAALSAGELSTILLVLPPGVTTLSQRLFEFLHFGMRYQDSGLCLGLIIVGWFVALAAWNTRKGFQ